MLDLYMGIILFISVVGLVLLVTGAVILFYLIFKLQKLEIMEDVTEKGPKHLKREHTSIKRVDYSSSIKSRKEFDKLYMNDKGLYEPVKPKKGIEIKAKEE